MPRLRVTLAGALTLQRGPRRVGHRAFSGSQLPVVTALLVLRRDQLVPVEALAEQLWQESTPEQWRVAVRGLVSRLRRALSEVGYGDEAVIGTPGIYRVQLGEVEVDVEGVPGHLVRARELLTDGQVEAARDEASAARQVASRPVLAEIDAPFLVELRRELVGQRIDALDLLADCRTRAGEYAHAVTVAREAVRLDPFRESSWRHLLSAHAAAGDVAVALRGYERLRRLLAEELGVDPSPQTRALHAELLAATTLPDVDAEPAEEPPPGPPERVPYRGLLAFRAEDANLFFGRDAQVQELVDRLAHSRAVAVTGPSGSGKSSLVHAGLLPALTAGALPEADTWPVALLTPGAEPLEALAAALVDVGDAGPDPLGRLWVDEGALRRLARTVLHSPVATSAPRLLLVVDQAEELFTVCDDAAQRRRFVSVLLEATRGPDAPVRVVLAMRADFAPQAATLPELAELMSTSHYVVPPLDGDGYEVAVVGPAREVGVDLEPGLVGRILADVAGEPGALPLLQHALLELWQHRDGQVLTVAAYEAIGGVPGALAHRAEAVHQDLDDGERAVARRLLLRMVHPGQGTGDTRRRVTLEELRRDVGGPEVVDAVVGRLVDARLLTTSADVAGEAVVEVAHEALITSWPRLAGWIADAREDLLLHDRLAEAANEWVANDRADGFLLRRGRLAQHEAWTSTTTLQLSPVERELLDTSRTRADEEAHSRRRRQRATMGVVSGAAVVALVLAGLAFLSRQDAARQRDTAQARRLLASSAEVVDRDPELALLLALEAAERLPDDPEAAAALHRSLAANRNVLSAAWPVEDTVSTQVDMTDDGTTMAWAGQPGGLVEVRAVSSGEVHWQHDFGDQDGQDLVIRPRFVRGDRELLVTVQFSPRDNAAAATPPPDAVGAHVFDVATGDIVRTLPTTRCGVWGAAGGAQWASVVSDDGDDFVLWNQYTPQTIEEQGCPQLGSTLTSFDVVRADVRTGELATVASDVSTEPGVYYSGLSHDGRTAAFDPVRGPRRIVEVDSGEVLLRLPDVVAEGPVALSADGTRVAVSAGETRALNTTSTHRTAIYDVTTGERVSTTTGHAEGVQLFMVRFSLDGQWLYTSSADGTVRIWDVETGQELDRVSGLNAPTTEPRLSRDRTRLVTATRSPEVIGVDLTPGGRPEFPAVNTCETGTEADQRRHPGGLAVRGDRLMIHVSCRQSEAPGRVRVVERATGTLLTDVPALGLMAAISDDGRLIASQDWSARGRSLPGGAIVVHAADTGRKVAELDGLCTWDWAAVTSQQILETDLDGAAEPSCREPPTTPFAGSNEGIVISPDNRLVAVQVDTGGERPRIVVSDVGTGAVRAVVPGDGATFAGDRGELITYEHVGRRLVAYDAAELTVLREGTVTELPFFEDLNYVPDRGELVARTANLGDARILRFDVETLDLVSEQRGVHEAEMTDLTVNTTARLVATGSADGRARVWDLDSGRLLHEVVLADVLAAVAMSEDGGTLYTATTSGPVRGWILDRDELLEFARSRVTRDVTDAECDRYFDGSCPTRATAVGGT